METIRREFWTDGVVSAFLGYHVHPHGFPTGRAPPLTAITNPVGVMHPSANAVPPMASRQESQVADVQPSGTTIVSRQLVLTVTEHTLLFPVRANFCCAIFSPLLGTSLSVTSVASFGSPQLAIPARISMRATVTGFLEIDIAMVLSSSFTQKLWLV